MILGSGLLTSSWPRASDWLIKDDFTGTVAAGSVNGTAATPGPGTRTVTDTESKLSVGSGALAFAGGKTSPTTGDPGIWYGAQSRSGRAIISNILSHSGYALLGFDSNQSPDVGSSWDGLYFSNAQLQPSFLPAVISTTTTGKFAVVAQSSGAKMFQNVNGSWVFLWSTTASTASPIYPMLQNFNSTDNVDYFRVIQLPAPFDSDTGIATDVHSGAVAQGTTFVHEGNHILEYAATVPSGDNVDVAIRMQDTDNYWICRVSSGGDISLLEVVDGDTPVQRSTAAGVVSTGHRIVIIADGTTIKGYSNNTLRWTYASATNFATATAGKVLALGTGGAASNLIAWPRTLSGTAASILDKVSA